MYRIIVPKSIGRIIYHLVFQAQPTINDQLASQVLSDMDTPQMRPTPGVEYRYLWPLGPENKIAGGNTHGLGITAQSDVGIGIVTRQQGANGVLNCVLR